MGGLRKRRRPAKNKSFADWWSLTHVVWAAALASVLPWPVALVSMVLWEPVEVFVLSRLFWRFGIDFGNEHYINSISDVVFDVAGVFLAVWLVPHSFDPFGIR